MPTIKLKRNAVSGTSPTTGQLVDGELALNTEDAYLYAENNAGTVVNRIGTTSDRVKYLASGTGAVPTTVQAKLRESVSVLDFGAIGDGVTDNLAAFNAALATGKNVRVPVATSWYSLSAPVTGLQSYQEIIGEPGAEIRGNFADFMFKVVGGTSAAVSSVTAPIVLLDTSFIMADASELAVGEMFELYDVVADRYDVNIVAYKLGNTVYTFYPICSPFATIANIRVYPMQPIIGAAITGLTISNINATGSGISTLNTKDFTVERNTFNNCGYIGAAIQVSIGASVVLNTSNNNGKTSFGGRVVKSCKYQNNTVFNNRSDEPINLFFSSYGNTITDNILTQEVQNGAGVGGNSILLNADCYHNIIEANNCIGSATYAINLITNCTFNSIKNNILSRALLAGVVVENNSNYNLIGGNILTDTTILQTHAAIEITAACVGNVVSGDNLFFGSTQNISNLQIGPMFASSTSNSSTQFANTGDTQRFGRGYLTLFAGMEMMHLALTGCVAAAIPYTKAKLSASATTVTCGGICEVTLGGYDATVGAIYGRLVFAYTKNPGAVPFTVTTLSTGFSTVLTITAVANADNKTVDIVFTSTGGAFSGDVCITNRAGMGGSDPVMGVIILTA